MDNAHLAALQAKHAGLDALIVTELQRPHPDDTTVISLKKQKLKIKDELARA